MSGGQDGCEEVPKTTARSLSQAELSAHCHPNINKVLLAPCSHQCVPSIRQPCFFSPNKVKNRTNLMQSLAGNKYVPRLGQIGCESDGRSVIKFHNNLRIDFLLRLSEPWRGKTQTDTSFFLYFFVTMKDANRSSTR